MIRRLSVLLAAITAGSFVALPHSHVSALATAEFSEAVARKQIVTSPQITGPSGGALSWGLDRIDQRTAVTSSRAYNFSDTGTGVKAYVLDSGINASHPEFGARVLDGWSYRASTTALNSYKSALQANVNNPNNGIEACANDGTHAVDPGTFDAPTNVDSTDKGKTDNDGHGTHVAGIIGGDTTGVAKNVSLVPVRTLDSCGNGTTTMILEGLAWILSNHAAGEKAILNLSIGFDSSVASVDNAITSIMNEGVIVVAAAGNGDVYGNGISACGTTPAATLGTISVGASTMTDGESSFSNYGQCVDIFSPGSSITSTFPFLSGVTNTYATQSGTSMAAPFISGTMARFLQSLGTGPTNFSTGPTAAWNWLKIHSTCGAITYASHPDAYRTPNRLLATADAPVAAPCAPTAPIATASSNSVALTWAESISGNGAAVSYTVSAAPGNQTCTTATNTCTVTGLTNGTTYVFSVVATNSAGASSAVTVSGAPNGPIDVAPSPTNPSAPTGLSASVASKSVTLNWTAVSNTTPLSYVVTFTNGATVCTTLATTCTVTGLTNGIDYSFTVASQAQGLMSVTSSQPIVVRPGFTVLKTVVAKKSKTPLTWFVKSISTGKRTWSESGPCSISSGRLVAISKATKCVVTLKVAKTSKYPAMSTKVTITVK
ncbi:MAG: hypothetical protein RL114_1432 [Actinomycetota bacterium]